MCSIYCPGPSGEIDAALLVDLDDATVYESLYQSLVLLQQAICLVQVSLECADLALQLLLSLLVLLLALLVLRDQALQLVDLRLAGLGRVCAGDAGIRRIRNRHSILVRHGAAANPKHSKSQNESDGEGCQNDGDLLLKARCS
jgi:hypothetical protein